MQAVKIQLIIFDLDDTLLDTTGLLIPIARTQAFEDRILQPLPLMPGALENLKILSSKYKLALLTQGRVDAQMQKVKSLGIGSFFQEQYFTDSAKSEHKGMYFARIRDDWGFPANEIMSIGNRRTTDIREAKKVGMKTCLFKYGEHQNEVIEVPEDKPDFEVTRHQELIAICKL